MIAAHTSISSNSSPIRVGLIMNSFVGGPHRGSVTKITENLIVELQKAEGVERLVCISENEIPLDLPELEKLSLGSNFYSFRKKAETARRIDQLGLDLVLCMSEAFLPPAFFFVRATRVLMLHGAEFFSRPKERSRARHSRREIVARMLIRLYRSRIDRFLTVSHYAIEPWASGFRLPVGKFDLVPHGISPDYSPSTSEEISRTLSKFGISSRYILHVGNFKPQKNPIRILDAFRKAKQVDPSMNGIQLVFVGPHGNLYRRVSHLAKNDSSVIILGKVSEEELLALYSGAEFLCFPSTVESFGMPVIESMACGTPVLTSTVSALPEVAGECALLVNPEDTEDIAEGIRILINDHKLRESFRFMGLSRSKMFLWSKVASAYISIMQNAIKRGDEYAMRK